MVYSNGIVEGLSVTSANVHDTFMFPELFDKAPLSEGDTVYADKGYHSEKNKDILKQRKLKNQTMNKRKRNEPENAQISVRNKQISRRRYVVERTFGSLKRRYGWGRTRYISLPKNNLLPADKGPGFQHKTGYGIDLLKPGIGEILPDSVNWA